MIACDYLSQRWPALVHVQTRWCRMRDKALSEVANVPPRRPRCRELASDGPFQIRVSGCEREKRGGNPDDSQQAFVLLRRQARALAASDLRDVCRAGPARTWRSFGHHPALSADGEQGKACGSGATAHPTPRISPRRASASCVRTSRTSKGPYNTKLGTPARMKVSQNVP